MVESTPSYSKSLSADSELQSAYQYLQRGEYKQCKRTIDKKMPKLKSELDRVNFNIVKYLLLIKLKKLKDAKKLMDSLKKEVMESPSLSSNDELLSYFKNVLREYDEEVAANEVFKHSIKNYNLAKISRTDQFEILKELTINYEFQELYAKINAFLKNDNDPDIKFLTLLKYEVIYILAFKYEKLSKVIVNLTLKEMLNNYATLSAEKGFIDILVKFLISLNDGTTFLNLFEGKQIEFTNAPINDLLLDMYYKKDEKVKLANFLINLIRNDLSECNFTNYERLVNFIFDHIEKSGMIITDEKVFKLILESQIDFTNFSIEELNNCDINSIIAHIYLFFDNISKTVDLRTNFNAFKSATITKILILHNLIKFADGKNYDLFQNLIFENLVSILNECVFKQSILTEISRFFIYLNESHRYEIINKFNLKKENFDINNNNDKEKLIFYFKLNKMLSNENVQDNFEKLKTKIDELLFYYFKMTQDSPKLEKGERILGDDLIILINEYYFEFVNKSNESLLNEVNFNKLSFALLSVNSIAFQRSPYNYDISLFYLRSAVYLNMPAKVLEILKFMNLKGPQFETVSYIAFPCFLSHFYKPGLTFLIENFEKWEKTNKKSIRKTFWKMFTGRNFWNTEELLMFLQENDSSYFKYILNYLDIIISYNDNLTATYEDESMRKENFNDISEMLINCYSKFEKKYSEKKLSKNQDLLISIFKFENVKFLSEIEGLKKNINFNEQMFKYKIDTLGKNSVIYQNIPGYKNNFLKQNSVEVLTVFDNEDYLNLAYLNKNILYLINDNCEVNNLKSVVQKYVELIEQQQQENNCVQYQFENINKNVLQFYLKSIGNFNTLTSETDLEILQKTFSHLSDVSFNPLLENSKNLNVFNFSLMKNICHSFQNFRCFNLQNFTTVMAKINQLINTHKKQFSDANGIKTKVNNLLKVPVLNVLTDFSSNLEQLLKTLNNEVTLNHFYLSCGLLREENVKYLTYYKEMVSELAIRYHEEQKEELKGLIEASKNIKNYIKSQI